MKMLMTLGLILTAAPVFAVSWTGYGVPEPTTLSLGLIGLGAFGAFAAWRKNRNK